MFPVVARGESFPLWFDQMIDLRGVGLVRLQNLCTSCFTLYKLKNTPQIIQPQFNNGKVGHRLLRDETAVFAPLLDMEVKCDPGAVGQLTIRPL